MQRPSNENNKLSLLITKHSRHHDCHAKINLAPTKSRRRKALKKKIVRRTHGSSADPPQQEAQKSDNLSLKLVAKHRAHGRINAASSSKDPGTESVGLMVLLHGPDFLQVDLSVLQTETIPEGGSRADS